MTINTDVLTRAQHYVNYAGFSTERTLLHKLAGDASPRTFVRMQPSNAPSRILVIHPNQIDPETLPLVRLSHQFRSMQLPVPSVLDVVGELGIVVMTDLGDSTLFDYLKRASETECLSSYQEAIGLIATMQRKGTRWSSSIESPFGPAFDTETFFRELEFFVDHFLVGYRKCLLTKAGRASLMVAFRDLARELASEPQVLCHRDYHSRNLMVCNQQLYVIDFQDARMGPPTYDLVSLLRDSYVELNPDLVEQLIMYYSTLSGIEISQSFRERFDRMTVQRNLKALGTFGYQYCEHKNSRYLEAVPRTLFYLQDALAQNSQLYRLKNLLIPYLGELRS